jgi:transcriptional regulator with XRE-family HTH domain
MQVQTIKILNMPYDDDMQQGRPTKRTRSDFGQKVFEARKRLGVSQSEIASQLDITQSAYAAWERDAVALRPAQLAKLSGILGESADELIGIGSGKRSGGPSGKARRLFEEVSRLPRSQQLHVLTVVEAFVEKKVAGIKS